MSDGVRDVGDKLVGDGVREVGDKVVGDGVREVAGIGRWGR